MKKISIFLLFTISFSLFSEEFDISKIKFSGLNIKSLPNELSDESLGSYNIAYSAILPSGAVYIIEDTVTGKEAIVEIAATSIDTKSPYVIYLTDKQFQFFTSTYEKNVDFLTLSLKFLGWNKKGDTYSRKPKIVTPERSGEQILKNGANSSYIQIGSFSYYQNGYPMIVELIEALSIEPNFYVIKSKVKDSYIYKIVAGPYSKSDADAIMSNSNLKERNLFIKSYNSVVDDLKDGNE